MSVWLILLGYGVGAIPFALLLSRGATGTDVRFTGSGNVGAANVLRTSGRSVALAVMVLDIAKGSTVVWVAERLGATEGTMAMTGLAAVIGHVYPLWLKLHGGKGVATACGVFGVLMPQAALVAAAAFVAVVWFTRYVSLGSIVASLVLPVAGYLTGTPHTFVICAVGVAALIVMLHRTNVARLHTGTERVLGQQS
jgi:glycerol-3-phosphate acyltransferase PlsY